MNKSLQNVCIVGTGSYAPEKIYTNKFLETLTATSDIWIQNQLGIKERRIAAEGQTTSDLAAHAARAALASAEFNAEELDLIIVATATPDRYSPATACLVQEKIGAYNAAAFDLSAVCSGFLFAMTTAVQFIANGMYNRVLVIGADTFSRITDWKRRDCVFFGDGAGAAILAPAQNDNEGFLGFRLYSDGRGKNAFTVPAGGSEKPTSAETLNNGLHYFQMNGREVFDSATKVLPEAINQVLDDTRLTVDDIDYMIPHQPSINILKTVAEKINLPFEKVMTNMDRYANTSGGTIPILLDEVNKSEKLKKGDIILFAAVGSGLTWGASILRWT